MSTIVDALTWSGSGATLSLFALFAVPPSPGVFGPESTDRRIRIYALDDEEGSVPGRSLIEYDFQFGAIPGDLREVLASLLDTARKAGAVVAWFGFEGSFNFGHLLTCDVASQVYALVDSEGAAVATDEDLPSAAWCARVVRAGRRARSELP